MREILFRGKTVIDDKWVYGDLRNHLGEWIYTPPDRENDGYPCVLKVDNASVGQFTGLTDSKGVKVFEGDIVRADNGHIGYVVFRNGSFVKLCLCHKLSINTFYGDNETVIGNTYDNPELLREGKA